MSSRTVLVLGGTRSGKSSFASARAAELAEGGPVAYLGTVLPGDPELDERVARHRLARPAEWPTIDVGPDLAEAVAQAEAVTEPDSVLLLDGLTLWLSAIASETVDLDALLEGDVERGLRTLLAHQGPVVVVSDEIGLGIVPLDAATRRFRDLLGIVHQRLAREADEVHFLLAGLPLTIKGAR